MRRAPFPLALLLAVACGVGGGPSVAVSEGSLSLERGSPTLIASGGSERLRAGDALSLAEGRATITAANATRVELLAGTRVIVEDVFGEELGALRIVHGRVAIGAKRAAGQAPVEVRHDAATISLSTGDVFLSAERTGRLEIEVLDGAASVSGSGKTLEAASGQILLVSPGLQPYVDVRFGPGPFSQSPLATKTEITVDAQYGTLSVRGPSGLGCIARMRLPRGAFGELPPLSLTGKIDQSGHLAWTYATPRVPSGDLTYFVECADRSRTASASGSFRIELRQIRPTDVAVHVTSGVQTPDGRSVLEERFVPLRDRTLEQLRARLPAEWKAATRNLGGLRVTESGADISIEVLAGTGTSTHWTARDGTQKITIYVADQFGPTSVENLFAVALHELGHIWCCQGTGTTDGHWTTAEVDPSLSGVDRFGLMNHPVQCVVQTNGVVSCPNRFSARELREIGFQNIPAP